MSGMADAATNKFISTVSAFVIVLKTHMGTITEIPKQTIRIFSISHIWIG